MSVQRAAAAVGAEHVQVEPLVVMLRSHLSSRAISHHVARHSKSKVQERAADGVRFAALHDELIAQRPELGKFLVFLQRVIEEKVVIEMLRVSARSSSLRGFGESRRMHAAGDAICPPRAAAAGPAAQAGTSVSTPTGLVRGLVTQTAACENSWMLTRPFLSGNYLCRALHEQPAGGDDAGSTSQPSSLLGALPFPDQEAVLVSDLLRVLSGVEGVHIRSRRSTQVHVGGTHGHEPPAASSASTFGSERVKFAFPVESSNLIRAANGIVVDQSLRELAERLLPLGECYLALSRFVHARSCSLESGLVMHAFCAALRGCLQEHLVGLAQLEQKHSTSGISLQQLWCYVQPAARSLATLDGIVEIVGSERGGALLKALFDRHSVLSGDAESAELIGYLLGRTAVPFLDMLDAWLHQGVLRDPYGEFMVIERPSEAPSDLVTDFNCQYWQRRFYLAPTQLPAFLQPHAEEVLTTGKSLHVIRECGTMKPVSKYKDESWRGCGGAARPLLTLDERSLAATIQAANACAASRLISLLMVDHQLTARLESVKHYFLLDQVDALTR